MIRVLHPLEMGENYFPWLFADHGNLFDNIGQAINFMQGYGLKDSEIQTFHFIDED
jgi:hypothetical protein